MSPLSSKEKALFHRINKVIVENIELSAALYIIHEAVKKDKKKKPAIIEEEEIEEDEDNISYELPQKKVKSSNLYSVGYDEVEKLLQIKFWGGSLYQYYNVPKRIYQLLMRAQSKGKYAHRGIYPFFSYDRVY